MTRVIGLILAAGSGSRMGRPKSDIVLAGERLVDRAVHAMVACVEVIVVVRDGTQVLPGARSVVNPSPESGMRSSLEIAVESAAEGAEEVDAYAVMLVDVPGVTPEAVAAVIDAWRPGRIAVATYDGTRGHPIVMDPASWREAIAMAGPHEGARRFLATRADLVDEVAVVGDPSDLDDLADLARWRRLLH
jgi:CTP:molybdopterin cytidylyltransferase MocA